MGRSRRIRIAAVAVLAASVATGCWGGRGDGSASATGTPAVGTPTTIGPPVDGAAGAGDRYFPSYGNGGYDVSHYRLVLSYNPGGNRLSGLATIDAIATAELRSFHLDLAGLEITELDVDGEPARWSRRGQELTIRPSAVVHAGDAFRTVVRYSGVPGGGFMHTNDGALVAGEPEAAASWFPVNDHPTDKAAYTFVVTVPAGLEAVANGSLVSRTSSGGRETWTWAAKEPMASYLATVAIGDFALREYRTPDGLPMWDAVDPDLGSRANRALGQQAKIIEFLARKFGPYPFTSGGGIVDNHDFGFALETQTRPVYSRGFFSGAAGEEIIVVHEIAHQWFGNSVSLARWQDIVLNEGPATYAEWLWMEEVGYASAQQAFDFFYDGLPRNHAVWKVVVADPGADRLFDVAVYWRGAMAMHQLRLTVGDADFFAILHRWTAERAGGNATVADFVALAEEVSGEQLDTLFRQWLSTSGKPSAIKPAGPAEPLTETGRRILVGRARGYID